MNNIKLVSKLDNKYTNDNIEEFVIYHLFTKNKLYNDGEQKIRYILLKNLNQFVNKIVWFYPILQIKIPIKSLSINNSVFLCQEIGGIKYANPIKNFCALIKKIVIIMVMNR